MKQLTTIDIYILKQEFPQLSLTEDNDIERYFEFRALNRQAEALQLYNTKIKLRYPDDTVRVLLMTCYRKRDPHFYTLLTQSLIELAERTTAEIRKIIAFFIRTVTPLEKVEIHTLIQVCEKVISAIAPDRFSAITFSEKYARYAQKLHYYEHDMQKATDIIRSYVTDSLSSVREFKEEQQRKRYQKKHERETIPAFDFSKITFTAAQIESIEISSAITRTEDQVLAYSLKYWNRYTDGVFENTILLYSRKYNTNHYNIFHAVKTGRIRKWKDEEILQAVLSNIARGYYYSMSGDLYLQRTWRAIRQKQTEKQHQHAQKLAPQKKKKPFRQSAPKNIAPAKVKKELSSKKKSGIPATEEKESKITTTPEKQARKNNSNITAKQRNNTHTNPKSAYKEDSRHTSIAGLIKKLTGKRYSVYREQFFKTIRPSIRAVLQQTTQHKLFLFGTKLNIAEQNVYQFLEEQYDNPYQKWESSKEKTIAAKYGFNLHSIEPIIRHWAQHNT